MHKQIKIRVMLIILILGMVTGFAQENAASQDAPPTANIEFNALTAQLNDAFDKQDNETAIAILDKMHALQPDNLEVIEILGSMWIMQPSDRPSFEHSLPLLLEAAGKFSSNSDVYYNLACIYSVKGLKEKAINELEKALYYGYTDIDWIMQDADFTNLHDTIWWKSFSGHGNEIVGYLNKLAQIKAGENDLSEEEIRKECQSFLEILKNTIVNSSLLNVKPLTQLAILAFKEKKVGLSVKYTQECYEVLKEKLTNNHPDTLQMIYSVAEASEANEDYDTAILYYKKANSLLTQIYGSNIEIVAKNFNAIGNAFLKKGDYDQTLANYQAALDIQLNIFPTEHPYIANTHNNIRIVNELKNEHIQADTMIDAGKYSQAIPIYEKLYRLQPANLALVELLGLLWDNEEKSKTTHANSLKYLSEAESRFSQEASIYYALACIKASVNDSDTAINYLEKALYFGETDIASWLADKRLVKLKDTSWWKTIASKAEILSDTLLTFHELNENKQSDAPSIRIYEYKKLAMALETCLPKNSLVLGAVNFHLALMYMGIDHESSQTAIDLLIQVINGQLVIFGEEHPEVATSYYLISQGYLFNKDYDNVIGNLHNALEIWNKKRSMYQSDIADCWDELALSYNAQKKYEQAIISCEKLLRIKEDDVETSSDKLADIFNRQGVIYFDMGNNDKAIANYQKAIKLWLKDSANEENLAISYFNLGQAYFLKDEYDQALVNYQTALSIRLKRSSPERTVVATLYNAIGVVFSSKVDYDQALANYQNALTIRLKILGPEHPDVATSYCNIGSAYSSKGDYRLALANYKTALDLRLKAICPEHPDVASVYNRIGVIYHSKGDYDQALANYQTALGIQLKTLGPEHLDVATSYGNIGVTYSSKSDYDQALVYHQNALTIRLKILGPEHPDVANSYNNIGATYSSKSDYDQALVYHQNALAIQLKVLGPEHPDVATSYNNIGTIYNFRGDYRLALANYQTALGIELKVLGSEHPFVAAIYNNIGLINYSKGDYDQAIANLQNALDIRLKVLGPEHPDVANSYNNIGLVNNSKGDYDQALANLKTALDIQLKILGPEHPDVALSYNNIGATYSSKSDYDQALVYHQNALAIQLKVLGPEHPDVARSYNNIGSVYNSKGDYDHALANYQTALAIQLKALGPDHIDVATSYNNIGIIYDSKGDYFKSVANYQAALAIQLKALGPEHADVARSYNNIGQTLSLKGDYDQALAYLHNALDVRIKALGSDHSDVAQSYNNLGVMYYNNEHYDQSLDYFKTALAIQLKTLGPDHTDVATSYNNIGNIYDSKGDYYQALANYQTALAIQLKKLGPDHPSVATSHLNIGIAFYHKGEYDHALANYQTALEIQLKVLGSVHPAVAWSYQSIGHVNHLQGNYDQAVTNYKKAFKILRVSLDFRKILGSTKEIGKYYYSTLPDLAQEAFSVGIDAVERSRLSMTSAKQSFMAMGLPLYYGGVGLAVRSNQLDSAFFYSESLRSRGFLDQMGQEAALRLEGVTDLERDKVRQLSSTIADQRGELERLNQLPLDKQDNAAMTKSGVMLQAAEKELIALDDRIGLRVPQYAQLRNPKPVDLEAAQRWCGPDRVILEYVLWDPDLERAMKGDDKADGASLTAKGTSETAAQLNSYCLVITDTSIQAVPLDGTFDYVTAINELRGNIVNLRNVTKFEALRNTLHQKLIAPVQSAIPAAAQSLVIVPDGALAFLPFDVLRSDAASDDLGTCYAISLSPSVSVSIMAQGQSASKSEKALAMGGGWYNADKSIAERGGQRGYTRTGSGGNADFDSLDEAAALNPVQLAYVQRKAKEEGAGVYFSERGFRWSDLPGTERELNELAIKAFDQTTPTVLKGDNATEANLKRLSAEGELEGYPFVHLACHGYFDNLVPEMSSIVLSEVSGLVKDSTEDGYLTVPEAALLNLNARMVSLSACETGLAKVKQGDGMVGLARALLVAGTSAVGVSLWSVDDDATAAFMVGLYTKVVKEGLSFRDAYAREKAEFRNDPKWGHPYFWAAFTMYE